MSWDQLFQEFLKKLKPLFSGAKSLLLTGGIIGALVGVYFNNYSNRNHEKLSDLRQESMNASIDSIRVYVAGMYRQNCDTVIIVQQCNTEKDSDVKLKKYIPHPYYSPPLFTQDLETNTQDNESTESDMPAGAIEMPLINLPSGFFINDTIPLIQVSRYYDDMMRFVYTDKGKTRSVIMTAQAYNKLRTTHNPMEVVGDSIGYVN